jgi:predicted lipoprotein with Yx(FWY)xxD motif
MEYRRIAIMSGALALASFVAMGTGAGAASTAGKPSVHPVPPVRAGVIASHAVTARPTVRTLTATVNGSPERILVNSRGLPLYYYQADTATKSFVSGELAGLWPPLLSARPTATGLRGKLSEFKVAAGRQVTYNGHFLYTFVEDSAGHVTGQGVSNFFVATPRLKRISSSPMTPTTLPPSPVNRYGY